MIEIDINPVALFNVRWYGILIAVGVAVLVIWIAWHVHRDKRISVDTVMVAALVGIPSGIIVSRAIHVIDLWDYYSRNPGEIISGMGLTIWGAILGGVLGIWITSKFTKFKFGYFSDVLAPGLILAQIIGRIGCTINGCCYGEECELPWAIIYTHPETFGPTTIAVHPTTVYEIIFLVISFVIIMFLRGRLKPEGSLFFTYLGMYSAWRIVIGFMREGTDFLFGLHQAQIIGIIVLVIIIPVMIRKTRWGKAEIEILDETTDTDRTIPPDSPQSSGNDSGEETETSENEVKND
jgi:phosphatidylglycerol:prolipoprotein diacylglycerol transferase